MRSLSIWACFLILGCTGEITSGQSTMYQPPNNYTGGSGGATRPDASPTGPAQPDAAPGTPAPDAAPGTPAPDAAPGTPPPDAADCIAAAGLPTPSDGHHNAGQDCLSCHANLQANLRWTVAGTLYGNVSGSSPVAQATIQIIDANGQIVDVATATNGNFWTLQPVAFPVHAKASQCPSTVAMNAGQSTGSCNSCHNAGFRIHLP